MCSHLQWFKFFLITLTCSKLEFRPNGKPSYRKRKSRRGPKYPFPERDHCWIGSGLLLCEGMGTKSKLQMLTFTLVSGLHKEWATFIVEIILIRPGFQIRYGIMEKVKILAIVVAHTLPDQNKANQKIFAHSQSIIRLSSKRIWFTWEISELISRSISLHILFHRMRCDYFL